MKTLLAYLYNHFGFLYLNPQYRITDSSTSGSETDRATIRFSGQLVSFWLRIERGQIFCDVAPTKLASPQNWFRTSIVRQYLDGLDEGTMLAPAQIAAWLRDNISRIEEMFADEMAARSCDGLADLERASADKRFGPG